jgi:hypothetical protein
MMEYLTTEHDLSLAGHSQLIIHNNPENPPGLLNLGLWVATYTKGRVRKNYSKYRCINAKFWQFSKSQSLIQKNTDRAG